MRRICTICAREGSKGVKNKNIRPLAGKPLLAHTILHAQEARLFDALAVSSDSSEILAVAKQYGVPNLVERPAEMADDFAPKVPAIRHCVSEVERRLAQTFETCVDLDATSPLRYPSDIIDAVQQLEESGVSNLFSVAPARRSPYFNLVEVGADGIARLSKTADSPIVRRQDSPVCYDINASIYVWRRDALASHDSLFQADTAVYVMPEERSVDIDNELDFAFVEFLLSWRKTA